MSILNFLQLQPVDPHDDGTTSDLDEYPPDETIDLKHDIDEQELDAAWTKITEDLKSDSEPMNFSSK